MALQESEIQLDRFPKSEDGSLRAWDAADEYIVDHVVNELSGVEPGRLLIINDNFGAIAISLLDKLPVVVSDSYLSHRAIEQNLTSNELSLDEITLVNPLDQLDKRFDLILVKVPKSLAELGWILEFAKRHAAEGASIVGAGMTKNVHTSTMKMFESLIGETSSSLARKKARLIYSALDTKLNSKPKTKKTFDFEGLEMESWESVFAAKRIDQGSQLLIEIIPKTENSIVIADVGCGMGILGLAALRKNPNVSVHFSDESFLAIDAARKNATHLFPDRETSFIVDDCLNSSQAESFDLILCNPPFHSSNAISLSGALRMFKQSHESLKIGGSLLVVGNQHLGYHKRLEEIFGKVETFARDAKFAVLLAVK